MEFFWVFVAVVAFILWRALRRRKAVAREQSLACERSVARNETYGAKFAASLASSPDVYIERTGAGPSLAGKSLPPARWIARGEAIEVGKIRIESGLIYVGRSLRVQHGDRQENCLIDPSLPVAAGSPDKTGMSMPYWPSYTSIQPSARRGYLQWLAGGRIDPEVGIGHVFLFFYGLERRFFIDSGSGDAMEIIEEVQRLKTLYGNNESFRKYSDIFLEAASLVVGVNSDPPRVSGEQKSGYEIPLSVRVYLGKRLAEQDRCDAESALLWLLSVPDTFLRTPATRCFDEFQELWAIRFAERHPSGLRIAIPKTKIKLKYRAASNTFEINVGGSHENFPDVSAVTAPLNGLRDLASACTDELDAYSRLLGRKPEAKGTIEAASLLPEALANAASAVPMKEASKGIDALFGGRSTILTDVSRLLKVVGLAAPDTGKLTAAASNQLGALLDRLGVGFEPDRRYGSAGLEAEDKVVIFKAANGAPAEHTRPDYAAARTMVEVAALAAVADGDAGSSEFESLRKDLSTFTALTQPERSRLVGYALALFRDPPKHQSILRRMEKLPASERERIVQSAISAVMADGHVTPEEVRFLERLHKALGLPHDGVYAALHRSSVEIDEPVVVAAAEVRPGVRIPTGPACAGIEIDEAKLARIRSETQAVSALLADIFQEEAAGEIPASRGDRQAVISRSLFDGLDASHGKLLAALLEHGALGRASFESTAKSMRLLPDGAIETINDWAFDRFSEPLLDGEDVVMIAEHLRGELRHIEAMVR